MTTREDWLFGLGMGLWVIVMPVFIAGIVAHKSGYLWWLLLAPVMWVVAVRVLWNVGKGDNDE